jgi:hemoglobin-like flavoprotein
MHADQIALIRSQFALLKGAEDIFAAAFYARLFELAPAVRPMFPTDIEDRSRKLSMTLAFAINSLDRPEILRPVVVALGARHLVYGAKMDQFGLVGVALLDTLARTLGEAFDFRAMDAWGAAYGALSDMMRDGLEAEIHARAALSPRDGPARLSLSLPDRRPLIPRRGSPQAKQGGPPGPPCFISCNQSGSDHSPESSRTSSPPPESPASS